MALTCFNVRMASCETCPHRIPMDRETWDKVKKAQREATPELSRAQCAKLTRIERKTFEGLEGGVQDCEGYSPIRAMGNYVLRKISIGHRYKKTEAGGLRSVGWSEKTCNNPWLDSPAYFKLQDEFQAVGSEGAEEKPSPLFDTDKQRYAFIEGNIATTRMVSGMMLVALGAAAAEAAPEPISAAGTGFVAWGLYRAATGGIDMARATWTEFQEHRNSS